MDKNITQKMNEDYRNFAFISYSRKDSKWAKWLQKHLERYRLPVKMVKKYKGIPTKISPVFLDTTDLGGIVLEEALKKSLKDSRYLIVICSPNSVASEYVSFEIQYFKSLGRENQIIPFIVEGEPFAEKLERECFPADIRNIKPELLGINALELGKDEAFLWIVATLLNLYPDELIKRENIRRRNKFIVMFVISFMLVIGLGVGIWYSIPHSKYYNAYTYIDNIPMGICELSSKQQKVSNQCYRITKQRGQTILLEIVNSKGVAIDSTVESALTEYAITKFQYTDSGELYTVEQFDATGTAMIIKKYTYEHDSRKCAIDFQTPSNKIQALSLSADMMEHIIGDSENRIQSQISRVIATYDENGYLIQEQFYSDNRNHETCDSNGVYGRRYFYTESGLIETIQLLNNEENMFECKYGWSYVQYAYDQNGNLSTIEYYDMEGKPQSGENGYFRRTISVDDNNNIVETASFDQRENPCIDKNGYHKQVCGYNEFGELVSVKYFTEQDVPGLNLQGVSEWHLKYDETGRICEKEYFDTDGKPAVPIGEAYVAAVFYRDTDGRLIQTICYDENDKQVLKIENVYEEGRWVSEAYYGSNNQPILYRGLYHVRQMSYDENKNSVRLEYLGVDKKLHKCSNGYAIMEWEYDEYYGNEETIRFYDEKGQPCVHKNGYALLKQKFEEGRLISMAFYDVKGEPTNYLGFHEYRKEYENGNCIRWTYLNERGEKINNQNGYAVLEIEYDENGKAIKMDYIDESGKLIDSKK